MLPPRLSLSALLLFLAFATPASAQDTPGHQTAAATFPQGFDQVVYKGIVGNVLDNIPMDPSKRLDLQRTNAVVGNTLLGRSLAVLAGLSNPVLMLGGFAWGVWAASNIKPADSVSKLGADRGQSGSSEAAPDPIVALLVRSSAVEGALANNVPEPILERSISTVNVVEAALSPSHVIKIWPPQRSPMPP